jgi:hypothetical protein
MLVLSIGCEVIIISWPRKWNFCEESKIRFLLITGPLCLKGNTVFNYYLVHTQYPFHGGFYQGLSGIKSGPSSCITGEKGI